MVFHKHNVPKASYGQNDFAKVMLVDFVFGIATIWFSGMANAFRANCLEISSPQETLQHIKTYTLTKCHKIQLQKHF